MAPRLADNKPAADIPDKAEAGNRRAADKVPDREALGGAVVPVRADGDRPGGDVEVD